MISEIHQKFYPTRYFYFYNPTLWIICCREMSDISRNEWDIEISQSVVFYRIHYTFFYKNRILILSFFQIFFQKWREFLSFKNLYFSIIKTFFCILLFWKAKPTISLFIFPKYLFYLPTSTILHNICCGEMSGIFRNRGYLGYLGRGYPRQNLLWAFL